MMKLTLLLCFWTHLIYVTAANIVNPRVCVIGAGIAGLSTARYLKEEGINFTVYEATNYVGGTWRYDERVGTDEYGYPIYSSMYKHLRTNLPKVAMELRGFPIPNELASFPSWEPYYKYVISYADHFDLKKYIKFLHRVVSVKRVGNIWKVKHKYLPTGEENVEEYDFIVIGTGHYSTPNEITVPGENLFKGTIIHSHDYKVSDPYKCRRVLIIGAGPSGMDIGLDVADVSRTVFHSLHSKIHFRTPYPPHYIRKPDVKEFNETGVIFVDGTYEDIDDVIYCTGYKYDYPFLDETAEININPRSVTPLHRNLVNINQPTMVFLGLIVRACIVVVLDAQARYTTALIKGNFTLPSHQEMMDEWQRHVDVLRSSGRPLSHIHLLARNEDKYYAGLTEESGIERVPPVIAKIHAADMDAIMENLYTFRNYVYTVIDRDTFTRHKEAQLPRRTFACTNSSSYQ